MLHNISLYLDKSLIRRTTPGYKNEFYTENDTKSE